VLSQESDLVAGVVNLVVNALDVVGARGTIVVSTGTSEGGAWIRVKDDGPGMSEELKARVFEPFFTTKGTQGTGLGLAMVYGVVQRNAGRVTLDSAPGQGACFTLWFPAA
jgi:signal transduction histidine kinase